MQGAGWVAGPLVDEAIMSRWWLQFMSVSQPKKRGSSRSPESFR